MGIVTEGQGRTCDLMLLEHSVVGGVWDFYTAQCGSHLRHRASVTEEESFKFYLFNLIKM